MKNVGESVQTNFCSWKNKVNALPGQQCHYCIRKTGVMMAQQCGCAPGNERLGICRVLEDLKIKITEYCLISKTKEGKF